MNDVEIVKQCLDTILKKGDLYDAIAEREGVKLQKHSFIRHHVLLFLEFYMVVFVHMKK